MITRFTTTIRLLVGLSFFLTVSVHAQTLDSLFSVSDTIPTIEKRIDWLNGQAHRLRNVSPTKSLGILDSTLMWSKKIGNQKLEGRSYNLVGIINKHLANYEKSLEAYSKALPLFQQIGDAQNEAKCLSNIGVVYEETADYDLALKYYHQSLAIDTRRNDEGNAALKLYNIGAVHELKEDYDSALYCYNRSLEIEERLDNPEGVYYAYTGLAGVSSKRGEFGEAMTFIKKSLEIAREMDSPGWEAYSLQEMGSIYVNDGLYAAAVEKYLEALAFSEQLGYRNQTQDLYKNLSEAYSKQGDYQNALQMFVKYDAVKDSVNNLVTADQLSKYQAQFETEKKEQENEFLRKQNESDAATFTLIIVGVAIFAALVLLLALFIFRGYRTKRLANEQLSEQSARISEQKNALEKIHEHITDSIEYAKRIQDAILPPSSQIANHFPEHMVFYRPKDIVSGDFYWMHEGDGKVLFAVADCTGHGVPGAFMSIVGHSLLEKIVKQLGVEEPPEILRIMSKELYGTLRKGSNTDVKDGMDIGLWELNTVTNELTFAGAHHPMYLIRGGELQQFKGDKVFLGRNAEQEKPIQSHKIQLQPGDTIYMFSDGFADQKGGPKGKKFYYPPFRDLLVELQERPILEHEQLLYNKMKAWKGNREQIDDMLVVALRIKGGAEKVAPQEFSSIEQVHESQLNGNAISSYFGAFDSTIVNDLLKDSRSKLEEIELHPKLVKKGYNVLVECVENINKHAAHGEQGGFVLAGGGEQLTIAIANMVHANEIEKLEANIAEVNASDRTQLKELYRNQISDGAISERGGAGLGLIDIALKSGSKLEHKFHPQDGNTSIFTLKVELNV